MKSLIIAAFVTTMGLAAVPASALPAAPGVSESSGLVQTIDTGCARGYYRSHGRCIPYSRSYHGGPRYGYYGGPRYYSHPRYYGGRDYVPSRGCPRGMHPGNSGRCVPNY